MRNVEMMLKSCLLGLAIVAILGSGRTCLADTDVWRYLRPLAGEWIGQSSGVGGDAEVTHEWDIVLQGKFLRLTTRSVAEKKDGSKEYHEDMGFLSRNKDKDTFVFRQFLSEGFVNTYDVKMESEDGSRVLFDHRESEGSGGMRARMRLTWTAKDAYELVLELAAPDERFAPCQTLRMKRAP